MNPQVETFLNSLKTYLYGDLDTFRKICNDIEQNKSTPKTYPEPHITASNAAGVSLTTPTTTVQTTIAEGQFSTSGYGNLYATGQNHFRSTIPHALAVFSAIDLLGYLIGKKKKKLQKRISNYL
jgi:hypothetical protein